MNKIQNNKNQSVQTRETERVLIGEHNCIKQLLFNAIGLVLAGSSIYGYNPMGLAFFAALNMYRGMGMLSMAAMALGMANTFYPIEILKYVAILFAVVCVYRILSVGKLHLSEAASSIICTGVMLIMEIADYIMNNETGTLNRELVLNLMLVSMMSILTGIMCYIFAKIIRAVFERKQLYTNEEMLGLAFMLGVFIYSLGTGYNVPLSGVEIMIFFAVIFSAYRFGMGMGALMGAACSLPLSIWSGEMNYTGILCIMGLIMGICRELGKTVTVVSALAYGMGIYMMFPQYMGNAMVKGMLGALVIFAMLPRSIVFRYEENINSKEDEGIKQVCEERLMSIAKTFDRLSKSIFKEPVNCGNVGNEIYFMSQSAGKSGIDIDTTEPINEEDVCSTERMSDRIWRDKFDESRMLMSNQLEQISKIIEEYSRQVYDFVKITDAEEEFIRNRLKIKKIYLDKIVGIENKRNKREYLVTAKCERGATIGSREIADVISLATGKAYMPSKNCRKLISSEYTTTTYVEETNFYVLHAMAGLARGESGISGDNYSLRELDNGQLLMGLSDGMGYGTSACIESETVIELLEQLLESGFDADTAMRMINSVMVMNSDDDHPATLDYGIIDLHSGMCDIVKIGAAATFVKRGNWVETIKSTSMPLGIFSEVDYDSTSKKLYDGDMIIMVSDGVVDAIESDNKDEKLCRIISKINSCNPKEIAEIILNSAASDKQKLTDDMTVLVTGIWKNQKKIA